MNNALITLVAFAGIVFISVAIALLTAFPVMLLWNWLMPVIFGLPTISVWQAIGLKVMITMLTYSHKESKKD